MSSTGWTTPIKKIREALGHEYDDWGIVFDAIEELDELAHLREVNAELVAALRESEAGAAAALKRAEAAEAKVMELEEKVESRQRQVDRLNAKLDDTHTHRCFKCESTVTEETSARQRRETQAQSRPALTAAEAFHGFEKARRTDRVHAAIDKCAEALEDVRGEVVDAALRAARDAGVGT